MKITLFSTLTCPNCGHKKTEEMPADGCQFFTSVKAAKPYYDQNTAIAACIVHTER